MLKVTCAIIILQNKILITQRNNYSDHPFKWEFPGGKLNPGETWEACVIREIREELDIDIEIQASMISVQYDYGLKQIELIPFICCIKKGDINLKEHKDFKWISFINLNKIDFAEADRKLIQLKENKEILKKYLWENMNNS